MAAPQQKSILRKPFQVGIGSLRKSLKSIFSSHPSSSGFTPPFPHSAPMSTTASAPPAPHESYLRPSFVFFGVLGIAGPFEKQTIGFMVTDYLVWLTFFWQLAGLHKSHSQSNSIFPIRGRFLDNKVIFREAPCDRLQLPVLPCLDQTVHTKLRRFSNHCKYQLLCTVNRMRPGETLVILLIGHASKEGGFRFYITSGYGQTSSAWITKWDLEHIVERCKAEIVVVCNSCHSGALESPLWTLLYATGSAQYMGYAQGSAFTLRTLARAGQGQVPVPPLPQTTPRPQKTSLVEGMDESSASPSTRLFASSTYQQLLESSKGPLSQFLQGMLDVERLLVMESQTHFPEFGSESGIAWHRMLPFIFKKTFAREIVAGFDPHASSMNSVSHSTQGSISVETLVEEQECSNKTLLTLTEAFVKVPHSPLTREGWDAKLALDFLQNIRRTVGLAGLIMYSLYTRHIQTVVVQEVARLLGWWVEDNITPFFSVEEQQKNHCHQTAMIESGIAVNFMVLRLPPFYPGIYTDTDRASSWWLAGKWADAGSPSITPQCWNDVVDAAAKTAKHRTLVTDEEDYRRLVI